MGIGGRFLFGRKILRIRSSVARAEPEREVENKVFGQVVVIFPLYLQLFDLDVNE